MYQLVDNVIFQFSMEDVLEHLIQALSNNRGSVQYWCAQMAWRYPHEELLPHMEKLLYSEDFDIKCATLSSLHFIKHPKTQDIVTRYIENETQDIVARYIEKETDVELIDLAKELFPGI
jgi:hypothetical protein